jgi:hypothetical protein
MILKLKDKTLRWGGLTSDILKVNYPRFMHLLNLLQGDLKGLNMINFNKDKILTTVKKKTHAFCLSKSAFTFCSREGA